MSSFKILISQNCKNVILNGRFKDYISYDELKNKLMENYEKSSFIKENIPINPNEKFILVLIKNNKNNSDEIYFPEDLNNSIWDNETYNYLKEKLKIRGINERYRFYIEKVENFPKFILKKNSEKLNQALDKYWEEVYKDITNELNIVKLEKIKNEFDKNYKNKNDIDRKNINRIIHKGLICCNCLKKDFSGKRFICSECNNYNLCQECENILYIKEIHSREHVFIQINKSFEQNNFFKYDNIIGNYNKEFNYICSDFFNLELTIVNIGENDLKNCYILPIRFGERYLDCIPNIIKESVKKNMSLNIELCIRKADTIGINSKSKSLEGYFRMLTPEGIPFGNVVFIKVLNWN